MRWRVPAVVAALSVVLLSGCRKENGNVPDNGIFVGESAVWPDSVALSNGITIAALNDSTLGVTVEGNLLRALPIGGYQNGGIGFSSDFPVLDLLCRLEASTDPLPARHHLHPYLLYLDPWGIEDSEDILRSRLKNGYVVPSETRGFTWPVVNDNAPWLLAATELYCARGGNRWLEELGDVAGRSLEIDYAMAFDPSTRLFSGLPRYMVPVESGSRLFPEWMDATDMSAMQSLTVNVAYWDALARMEQATAYLSTVNVRSRLPELPVNADSLKMDILVHYWQPRQESLSGLLYGSWLWPVAVDAADNLGTALAVATGLVPPPMARRLVAERFAAIKADPLGDMAANPLFTPSLVGERVYGGELLKAITRTTWLMAANDVAMTDAVEWMLGESVRQQAEALLSPESDLLRLRSLSTALLRGVLGVRFTPSGVRFAPVVPAGLKGEKRFTGFRYRRSILDVTLTGTGSVIKSFRLDGQEVAPRLSATLRGRHTIEIVMAQEDNMLWDGPDLEERENIPDRLPAVPSVRWLTRSRGVLEMPGGENVRNIADGGHREDALLCINGVDAGYISQGVFSVDDEFPAEENPAANCVQIAAVDAQGYIGFSAAPHWIFPQGAVRDFPASEVGIAGTKLVRNKTAQKQLVESHRYRNSSIILRFDAPEAGTYALDAEFLSGLGIVNRRWRNAVRGVWVNGARVGSMLLTQNAVMRQPGGYYDHSAGNPASVDDLWENMVSRSRPVVFDLPAGPAEIELRYVQPSPVFVDPTANNALFRSFRIFRID